MVFGSGAAITGCPAGACHRAGHFGPDPLAGHDNQEAAVTSGGVNARSGGKASVHSSISTMLVPVDGPWLSFDVPRSWVSTLALPWAQSAPSSAPAGSYQAPHDSFATPGDIVSVSTAPARQAPRAL